MPDLSLILQTFYNKFQSQYCIAAIFQFHIIHLNQPKYIYTYTNSSSEFVVQID